MKKTLIFMAGIFLAFFMTGQKARAADWSISTLTGARSDDISLAVDTNNKIYIGYIDSNDNNLKYTTNVSGAWVSETVDSTGNVSSFISLGLDTDNNVHIGYYDSANGDLKYATNASGAWVYETVDSADDVGFYTSLGLDANNHPHIAYFDSTSHNLKYAAKTTGAWVNTTLESAVIVGASLKLDTNNKAHISYYNATNQDLRYATNISEAWSYETAYDLSSPASAVYPSLALDTNNKAHISFSYWDGVNNNLQYTTNASGTWIDTTIDSMSDPNLSSSLSLDTNNNVHISYNYTVDAGNNDLKYATNVSGAWTAKTIDSAGTVGRPSSIALDANNKVHIGYYDWTNGNLKYAYTPGPSSTSVLVNSENEYTTSRNVILTLSAQGDPTKMIISERSDFSDASWEDYATTKNFTLSPSEGTKTIYAKFEDQWQAGSDAVSDTIRYIKNPKFVTKSAKKTNEVLVTQKNKKYLARDFSLLFKSFPKKLKKSKYYLQAKLSLNKYPKSFASPKKSILKKYWQIDTNLNKYLATKKSDKYKLQLVFKYTDNEFKALKKKNKSIKESKLVLKYYDGVSKTWKTAKSTHDLKKNTFTLYLPSTTLLNSSYFFTIGVK